jgi:hypothetical protein
MTNHIARLYAAAGAILALFLAWAGIAAHPWQSDQTTPVATRVDSQTRALAAYEKRLKKDARLVRKVVRRRAAEARAARQAATAAAAAAAAQSATASSSWSPAPSVRVVTLPPAAAPAASTKTS